MHCWMGGFHQQVLVKLLPKEQVRRPLSSRDGSTDVQCQITSSKKSRETVEPFDLKMRVYRTYCRRCCRTDSNEYSFYSAAMRLWRSHGCSITSPRHCLKNCKMYLHLIIDWVCSHFFHNVIVISCSFNWLASRCNCSWLWALDSAAHGLCSEETSFGLLLSEGANEQTTTAGEAPEGPGFDQRAFCRGWSWNSQFTLIFKIPWFW